MKNIQHDNLFTKIFHEFCQFSTILYTLLVLQQIQATLASPRAFDFAADADNVVGEIHNDFSCQGLQYGYYADQGSDCKVFHICMPVKTVTGRTLDTFQFSFFCPNQTRFSQDSRTCIAEEFAYPCSDAHTLYDLNLALGQAQPRKNRKPVNQKNANLNNNNVIPSGAQVSSFQKQTAARAKSVNFEIESPTTTETPLPIPHKITKDPSVLTETVTDIESVTLSEPTTFAKPVPKSKPVDFVKPIDTSKPVSISSQKKISNRKTFKPNTRQNVLKPQRFNNQQRTNNNNAQGRSLTTTQLVTETTTEQNLIQPRRRFNNQQRPNNNNVQGSLLSTNQQVTETTTQQNVLKTQRSFNNQQRTNNNNALDRSISTTQQVIETTTEQIAFTATPFATTTKPSPPLRNNRNGIILASSSPVNKNRQNINTRNNRGRNNQNTENIPDVIAPPPSLSGRRPSAKRTRVNKRPVTNRPQNTFDASNNIRQPAIEQDSLSVLGPLASIGAPGFIKHIAPSNERRGNRGPSPPSNTNTINFIQTFSTKSLDSNWGHTESSLTKKDIQENDFKQISNSKSDSSIVSFASDTKHQSTEKVHNIGKQNEINNLPAYGSENSNEIPSYGNPKNNHSPSASYGVTNPVYGNDISAYGGDVDSNNDITTPSYGRSGAYGQEAGRPAYGSSRSNSYGPSTSSNENSESRPKTYNPPGSDGQSAKTYNPPGAISQNPKSYNPPGSSSQSPESYNPPSSVAVTPDIDNTQLNTGKKITPLPNTNRRLNIQTTVSQLTNTQETSKNRLKKVIKTIKNTVESVTTPPNRLNENNIQSTSQKHNEQSQASKQSRRENLGQGSKQVKEDNNRQTVAVTENIKAIKPITRGRGSKKFKPSEYQLKAAGIYNGNGELIDIDNYKKIKSSRQIRKKILVNSRVVDEGKVKEDNTESIEESSKSSSDLAQTVRKQPNEESSKSSSDLAQTVRNKPNVRSRTPIRQDTRQVSNIQPISNKDTAKEQNKPSGQIKLDGDNSSGTQQGISLPKNAEPINSKNVREKVKSQFSRSDRQRPNRRRVVKKLQSTKKVEDSTNNASDTNSAITPITQTTNRKIIPKGFDIKLPPNARLISAITIPNKRNNIPAPKINNAQLISAITIPNLPKPKLPFELPKNAQLIGSKTIPNAKLIGHKTIPNAKLIGSKTIPNSKLIGSKTISNAKLIGHLTIPNAKLIGQKTIPNAKLIGSKTIQNANGAGRTSDKKSNIDLIAPNVPNTPLLIPDNAQLISSKTVKPNKQVKNLPQNAKLIGFKTIPNKKHKSNQIKDTSKGGLEKDMDLFEKLLGEAKQFELQNKVKRRQNPLKTTLLSELSSLNTTPVTTTAKPSTIPKLFEDLFNHKPTTTETPSVTPQKKNQQRRVSRKRLISTRPIAQNEETELSDTNVATEETNDKKELHLINRGVSSRGRTILAAKPKPIAKPSKKRPRTFKRNINRRRVLKKVTAVDVPLTSKSEEITINELVKDTESDTPKLRVVGTSVESSVRKVSPGVSVIAKDQIPSSSSSRRLRVAKRIRPVKKSEDLEKEIIKDIKSNENESRKPIKPTRKRVFRRRISPLP